MQVQNVSTKTIIDVPFAHAINVLLPQGKYIAVDDKVQLGSQDEQEDDSLHGNPIDEEITRKGLMDMLDAKEIKYRPTEKKADLLAMVQKAYNIKVINGNVPPSSK
jgi:hypothetical protein